MRTAVNSAAIVTVKNNGTGTAQNSSSMQLYLLRNRLSASSQVRRVAVRHYAYTYKRIRDPPAFGLWVQPLGQINEMNQATENLLEQYSYFALDVDCSAT
jgi:hypothetical protein